MNPAIIANAISEVRDLLSRHPEIAENDRLLADVIEGETSFAAVAERLVMAERERQAMRDGRAAYIKALQAKNAADDFAIGRLRATLARMLEAAGMTGFKCAAGTVGFQHRRGALKFAGDFDPAKLPEAYRETIVTHKPIKDAVQEALERGETIDGAYIGNATTVLTVRT